MLYKSTRELVPQQGLEINTSCLTMSTKADSVTLESVAPLSKITTSGENQEFVHIGDTRVLRHELMEAVGGSFSNQLHHIPTRKFANSAVLGLCAFSLTTFTLSLFNLHTRGLEIMNLVAGPAWFYGGMVQILVGLWEVVHENTFACVTFTSYGAFFLTFGALYTPAFGIEEAYAKDPHQLSTALGLYMFGWFIFSFLVTIVTIRSSWPLFLMFLTITMGFLLNGCGYLTGIEHLLRAAAGFNVGTACFGWYMAFEGLAKKETCYFSPSPFLMPGAQHLDHV